MYRLVVLLLSLFSSFSFATPLLPEQAPEPLKPWINWVLLDQPERVCPFIYNSYEQKRCSWPTRLGLNLSASKATFEIIWKVYQESWITLPGDSKHWPLNVSANNNSALVLEKNGRPSTKLAAGEYRIRGEFLWDAIPDNLGIPEDTGLIDLKINGNTIPSPAIKNGQLWLKASDIGQRKPENIQNNLDIQVFRKIIDDVPLQVLSRLQLEVSGEQREARLALPLLEGFIPLHLLSPLPARLEPDGQLLLQLRPGRWQIDILARAPKEMSSLPFKTDNKDWPQNEIWAFEAKPQLRVVEIENLSAIDPSLSNLPADWKHLPAYSIKPGQAMSFKLIRRGDPEPEPNQLNLTRRLWLDFDGSAYTANDSITGKMTRGWRLNALPETHLGKVSLDGDSQLITGQAGTDKQGVEVRKGRIALDADSRIVGPIGALSAVGWEQSFHHVDAELNLPPGWRLLAAAGVDNVPDSWISRWTLLDLFLVLIAALATGRLWNPQWGLFTLLTLALIWHEPDSPRYVWLNILAATALIKLLPPGKFLKVMTGYRNACWLALILIAVPFMIDQVRLGLYPQLENPWQAITQPAYTVPASDALMSQESMAMPEQMLRKAMPSIAGSKRPMAAPLEDKAVNFERIDPKAKVQTGPGLPQWQWTRVQLSWNGAVDDQQELQLWYLSPLMTLLLNFIRVVLIAVLALLMFGVAEKFSFKLKTVSPLLLVCLLLPAALMPSQKAYADFPDQAMLDELRNRLTEQPDCLPGCAQIPQMELALTDKELSLSLQIHAQKPVAVPLPADYEQWFPSQVSVDGKPAQGLFRSGDRLWLTLAEGDHQVELSGPAPLFNKFTLPLPLKPHRARLELAGWQASGLQENNQVDNQLQFNRVAQAKTESRTAVEPGILPPFVRLERKLQLGLDWRLITTVQRISPADSAVVLSVPLLSGESVTTAGIRVKAGKVEVSMAAGQTFMQWASVLEKSEKIDLLAAQTEQWIEVWKADISPIWHIESSGIAMIHLNDEGQWLPEWHPWPGEKITLTVTRPEAAAGQTLTIDDSRLSIKPGKRLREADLTISLRSSQGSQHTLTLPDNAVLHSVMIDGQIQPIRQKGKTVTLPIHPGKQEVRLNWQETSPIAGIISTPQIDLGQDSVNTNLNIDLGQDRWVLLTMGPQFGPAVLFWGMLLVMFLLALGLGKVRLTPLKNWQWFLLLLGLSQIPIAAAAVVVAWLMLLGWRADQPLARPRSFNALQVGLGVLTFASLALLFIAVEQGLLGSPDMQISGNQSSAFNLNWYQDRSPATLPTATVISVPLMAYRIAMLAWSLWLAVSLLSWLKWGWSCFAANGLWQKMPVKKKDSD